jgi:hypothetical protein
VTSGDRVNGRDPRLPIYFDVGSRVKDPFSGRRVDFCGRGRLVRYSKRLDSSTWNFCRLPVLLALVGICHAQESVSPPVSEPKATATSSESAPATNPPTSTQQKPFYKKLFSLQALYSTVPSAVVQQIHDWPDEWGRKRVGFEKRIASLYGQFLIGSLIEDGVKAIHSEDTRYVRLGTSNFFRRTGHVVTHTFLAGAPGGGRTPAYSLLANSYGSWAIATLWSPRELRTPGSIAEWGTAGMGATVCANVVREFWPDLKAVFRKKK